MQAHGAHVQQGKHAPATRGRMMRPDEASLLVSCLATSTQRRRGRGTLPPDGAGDCDAGVETAAAAAAAGSAGLCTAAWRRAGPAAGAALVACGQDSAAARRMSGKWCAMPATVMQHFGAFLRLTNLYKSHVPTLGHMRRQAWGDPIAFKLQWLCMHWRRLQAPPQPTPITKTAQPRLQGTNAAAQTAPTPPYLLWLGCDQGDG
jgi:hypothetical protein